MHREGRREDGEMERERTGKWRNIGYMEGGWKVHRWVVEGAGGRETAGWLDR